MFVAIPTAIPLAPFKRRFGIFAGKTSGSFSVLSKFGLNGTVSLSRSFKSSSDIGLSLTSLYLIAAGGSPSILPKLPCPSTKGYLIVKS